MALEFFETKTQFVKMEDGIKKPESSQIYEIRFSNDANDRYETTFPQFELIIKTGGLIPWQSYFNLCYRGFCFAPKYTESIESFILKLLNDLKQGTYNEKMCSLIQASIELDKYELIKGILKEPNIKVEQLEKELAEKQKQIDGLQKKLSSANNLKYEIEILERKIIEIKMIFEKLSL